MSREFVESFFPSSMALVYHYMPTKWVHALIPPDLDEQCPEVMIEFPTSSSSSIHHNNKYDDPAIILVRNPILAMWIVAGIFVGGCGWMQWKTRRQPTWAVAFAAFGGMNVAALPLHCVLPATTAQASPYTYPWLWMLDCLCTGLSSIWLVQGSLEMIQEQQQQQESFYGRRRKMFDEATQQRIQSNWKIISHTTMIMALLAARFMDVDMVHLLTTGALVSTQKIPNIVNDQQGWLQWKEPLWIELIYLGPTVVAAGVVSMAVIRSVLVPAFRLWDRMTKKQATKQKHDDNMISNPQDLWIHLQNLWLSVMMMLLGLILAALGILRMPWLCQHFPPALVGDAVSAPALVFAGCDVAFAGLHWWLVTELLVVAENEETTVVQLPGGGNGGGVKEKLT